MDARDWDERYRSADLVWGADPNRFVREQCESLPAGDAVDLACGEGRNSLWLAQLGWRVTGVDFSTVAIERAQALTRRLPAEISARITWRVADVTRGTLAAATPAAGTADLAVIAYLHVVPVELGHVVRHAAAALRPGGTLVIVGHDRRNLSEGVSGPQDINLLYHPDDLREQVERHRLGVTLAQTVERPTDTGTALDTLVRAQRPRSATDVGRLATQS